MTDTKAAKGQHTTGPFHKVVSAFGEVRISDAESDVIATMGGNWDDGRIADLFAAAPETAAERDRLRAANAELAQMLKRYIAAHPAFRMKPIGAPGSIARIEQEHLMALEDSAQALIVKAGGQP